MAQKPKVRHHQAPHATSQLGPGAGYITRDVAKTEAPIGALEAAIGSNAQALTDLANCIDMLRANMRNVLRPNSPPSPCETASAGDLSEPSPLVLEVRRLGTHIEALCAQVRDLNFRLEA